MNTYFTGFAIEVEATLQLNGRELTEPEIAALTLTAVLITPSRTLAAGTTAVAATKPGAGRVRAVWPAAQTGSIVPGRYQIEFRDAAGPHCYPVSEHIQINAGVSP